VSPKARTAVFNTEREGGGGGLIYMKVANIIHCKEYGYIYWSQTIAGV
jgi:hypothetical protein